MGAKHLTVPGNTGEPWGSVAQWLGAQTGSLMDLGLSPSSSPSSHRTVDQLPRPQFPHLGSGAASMPAPQRCVEQRYPVGRFSHSPM